ncbi:MAG: glycosyltransferase family 2 protein [Acidobacteriota bacterium]
MQPSVSAQPSVSVAIPVFNEEAVVGDLLRRLGAVLDTLPAPRSGASHEIVIVDDGSSDRTAEALRRLSAGDHRLVVIELSRNFGHQAAMSAALDNTTGDVVVMMDGDLQDAPEAIPRFLEEHAKGFEVVYARRVGRKEGWPRRLAYFLFYRLIRSLSRFPLPLDSGDFCLVSRQVATQMSQMPERHRYLRGLRSWVGFRQTAIDVEREARVAGTTKYTLSKLLRLAFDGIFSFSTLPLRVATFIGFLAMLASGLFASYAIYARLFLDRSPAGFTALLVAIVFLFGVQFLMFGILGEYVGRIYDETKARPRYIVRQITGQQPPETADG